MYMILLLTLSYLPVEVLSYARSNCPDGAYYTYPQDCTKVYQCDHNSPVSKYCGPGTAFNTEFNGCDYNKNVKNCQKEETISKKSQTCPHHGDKSDYCKGQQPSSSYPSDEEDDIHW